MKFHHDGLFDDVQVAIKFIPRGEKITKYVEREIVNHSHLLHPVSFSGWGSVYNHMSIIWQLLKKLAPFVAHHQI